MVLATLSIIASNWKHQMFTKGTMDKLCYIYTMEYYTAMKKKSTHTMVWVYLMLNERNQAKNNKQACLHLQEVQKQARLFLNFIYNVIAPLVTEDETVVTFGLRRMLTEKEHEGAQWVLGIFCIFIQMVIIQVYTDTNIHQIVH